MTHVDDATQTIPVRFAGAGSGRAELAWGQQHIWGAIQALGSPMNMTAVRPLAPGAAVAEFAEELRFYASRYQAMRTLLEFPPDGGTPRQVVVESGEVPLHIVDVPDAGDPAEAAEALAARMKDAAFDYAADFPIDLTLLRHKGALTHLVTTISHVATDAAGAFAMYEDFVNRDPATGRAPEPTGLQPLDLAARERTPAAIRQSDAALRYWEEHLRALPLRPAGAADPAAPQAAGPGRYWELRMESPAMLIALQAAADRLQTEVSIALLGVFTVALARATGRNPVAAQMLVSNRFRPGLAAMVGNISQTGLLVVDVADTTLDEAIGRAQKASIKTYKNAYFDLAQWKELIARVGRERGGEVDLGCYYNDRPSQYRAHKPAVAPTRDGVRAALAHTSPLTWTELPYFNEPLMVTVDDAPDAIALLVLADTRAVPKEQMEALARQLEALAVAAAFDPAVPTGVSAPAHT